MRFSSRRSLKSVIAGRRRGEDGTMLVEMVVSVLLLTIAMGMTVIIVGVLTKNVSATLNNGTSTDSAQSAILTLSSYVKDAVSPTAASQAALAPTTVTSTCWGASNIATQEGNSILDGWPSGGDETELNETTGIIFAHDFDLEFCGYGADASGSAAVSPNVYQIFVNTSSGSCTANNYCPVDITSYGNSSYSAANDYPPASPLTNGTLVASIGRVWCDQACQQLGISCSSITTAALNYQAAGMSPGPLPANYSTLCPAGYAGTPPLFNYYTNTGIGNQASPNPTLNWVNAYSNSLSNPLNVNAGATGTCTVAAPTPCGPMDMYTPNDELTMQSIQDVVLNMTVLAQNNPSQPSSKTSSVQITDQVWLRDLAE